MTDPTGVRTTVVIPVWDRYAGPRLVEAVTSIRSQERPARIVLVDNASTVPLPTLDGVEVMQTGARVSLGAARNFGLAAVATPNVIVWDADDLMTKGTLGFLEDEIERDPRLVAFGAAIVEEPAGLRHRWPRRWIARLVPYPRLFALTNSVWSILPTTGATLMRIAAVRDAGGYTDAESGDDWALGAALAFRGRIGWSERPGRLYLQHEGSIWDAHGSASHQREHAAAVRRRMSEDAAIPRWLRSALPLVAIAQSCAVFLHLVIALCRRQALRVKGLDT